MNTMSDADATSTSDAPTGQPVYYLTPTNVYKTSADFDTFLKQANHSVVLSINDWKEQEGTRQPINRRLVLDARDGHSVYWRLGTLSSN